jgi:D-serine deaminase-like pyridoxal phosphate-dependent protein
MDQPRIERPTLLLDTVRARRNIARMADKARRSGVRFRPHFKTHQSAQIGAWFREYGVEAITVSSVEMAEFFADHGWDDITIAFPLNWRQIERIDRLTRRVRLHLLVASAQSAGFLRRNLEHPANVWIEIDTGYGRTGLAWEDIGGITGLAGEIAQAPQLTLRGLLTHAGHTYYAHSVTEIEAIYYDTAHKMGHARQALRDAGHATVDISVGDTPGCSVVQDLSGPDEIRPGNFVLNDVMQWRLGSCREEDIAVAVACPIVAKHPERGELIIYGGAVHLSKDHLVDESGSAVYGLVAPLTDSGWGKAPGGSFVSGLSQEHGTVKAGAVLLDRVEIGDCVAILPVHACLTVNLMGRYVTLAGEEIPCAVYEP